MERNFFFLFSIKLKNDRSFHYFFIDQQIGTLRFTSPVLASETIRFNVSGVILPNSFVVKFDPLVLVFLDVREVMSKISSSIVKNGAF